MARLFGQNDIQSLLQHLNKSSSNAKSVVQKNSPISFDATKPSVTDQSKLKVSSSKRSNEFVAVHLSNKDRKRLKKEEWHAKQKAKEGGDQEAKPVDDEEADNQAEVITSKSAPIGESKPIRSERSKLLRNSCIERLMEAQFRTINEYLYTNSSISALSYMNQELFDKYHQAYRKIVERWPVKPLDVIIQKIEQTRPQAKKSFKIADLGCGDAQLAQHFANKPETQSIKVHSFDLIAANETVTQASMDNVPLDENSCDAVVFCLSLMGTNVKDCLLEANRILKKEGLLLIAEVSSRFDELSAQKFNQTMETFQFRMNKQQFLQPNDFFVLFQGRKIESVTKLKGLPNVTLKACRYKIR
jgi:ribosomal RNA-processing protein 8